MFVCLCKGVTDHQINDAVETGITSFEGMQKELDVSTVCGSCTCEVKRVMMEKFNTSLSAKHSLTTHSPNRSFQLNSNKLP